MSYDRNTVREKVTTLLLRKVVEDGSGQSRDIIYTKPSQKLFIGTLSPEKDVNEINKVVTKMSPSSIGLEILIPDSFGNTDEIEININGVFYFRIFPDYEEQHRYFLSLPTSELQRYVDIREKYIKKNFSESFRFNIKNLIEETLNSEKIIERDDYCNNLWKSAKEIEGIFAPIRNQGRPSLKIPKECSMNQDMYEKIIKSKKIDEHCFWGYKVIIKTIKTSVGYRILAMLSNKMKASTDKIVSKYIESSIFEPKINIRLHGAEIKSFDLDYLEKDYKHNRKIWATTINCSFDKKSANEVETVNIPVYMQRRKLAKDMGNLNLEGFVENPIPILNSISKELEKSMEEFKNKYKNHMHSDAETVEFENDLKYMGNEIGRFKDGINILGANEHAMRAFNLMNKAFLDTSRFNSWRPFQLVFIISVLPDIVAERFPDVKNHREFVDLLYFPTGGGKTEAFLGLAIFQAFFDRIMGKKFGVSAITKFPLRMLSLDQLNRIATVFFRAEIIRQQEDGINGEDFYPFSVGYFVGEGVTPNKLVKYNKLERKYENILEDLKNNKEKLEKYRIITSCPLCNSNVDIDVDLERMRILHVCTNKGCIGELPVYISDNEIYRYLPTFIVGTLDKMASVGLQINFRNILGGVTYHCKRHGFSSSSECVESYNKNVCNEELEKISPTDSSPSLLIQDEMHLVRDSLGTFDSHYETAIDNLVKRLSHNRKILKIVAATATLSEKTYQNHVEHLYLRPSIRFPSVLELFTKDSENTARLIVGIMPHGKTLINTVEEVMTSISKTVQEWISNKEALERDFGKESEIARNEIRDFWTLVSYHTKKNDAYQLDRSIETRINEELIRCQLKPLRAKSLTGDVDFKEIRYVMNKVKGENNYYNILDTIIATSIISHGIDIDVLNLMTFMGMPANNAEYMQALSRVGRRSEGLVFVIFNPIKERDRSYFKYFFKFHDLSELLIEAAPIQRWSKKALEKTCSGIFCASLFSYFDLFMDENKRKMDKIGKLTSLGNVRDAMNKAYFSDKDIIEFILGCYSNGFVTVPEDFMEEVNRNVSRHISSLLIKADAVSQGKEFIGNLLSPRPLMSLRDVEEGVEVSLTAESISVLRRGAISSDDSEESQ